MEDRMDVDRIFEFAEEWSDLEKPLIPLLRIIFLICLKSRKDPIAILSEQLVARLVQVSESNPTKFKHFSRVYTPTH
jgi:hypothetical protein